MPLTYDESATLMTDTAFRGRIKVAGVKFATTIMNEEPSITAHNARMRWAQMMYQQPDMVATQLQSPVVMDPAVQGSGSAIDDAGLQGAVEAVVNKLI